MEYETKTQFSIWSNTNLTSMDLYSRIRVLIRGWHF